MARIELCSGTFPTRYLPFPGKTGGVVWIGWTDFRTDNPFFPPLMGDKGDEWESVRTNVTAAKMAFHEDEFDRVMGLNAIRILDLH